MEPSPGRAIAPVTDVLCSCCDDGDTLLRTSKRNACGRGGDPTAGEPQRRFCKARTDTEGLHAGPEGLRAAGNRKGIHTVTFARPSGSCAGTNSLIKRLNHRIPAETLGLPAKNLSPTMSTFLIQSLLRMLRRGVLSGSVSCRRT
jgi:hypothetical protein